jgi:hypothetical protein
MDDMRVAVDQAGRHQASTKRCFGEVNKVRGQVIASADPGDAMVPNGNRGCIDQAVSDLTISHRCQAQLR